MPGTRSVEDFLHLPVGTGADQCIQGDLTWRDDFCPSQKCMLPIVHGPPLASLYEAGLSQLCLLAEQAVCALLNIHRQTVRFLPTSSVHLLILKN